LHKSVKKRAGVHKKIHILRGSAIYPGAAEYVMREITERYVTGFRDQNKSAAIYGLFMDACPLLYATSGFIIFHNIFVSASYSFGIL
jgi:hypothetical protein